MTRMLRDSPRVRERERERERENCEQRCERSEMMRKASSTKHVENTTLDASETNGGTICTRIRYGAYSIDVDAIGTRHRETQSTTAQSTRAANDKIILERGNVHARAVIRFHALKNTISRSSGRTEIFRPLARRVSQKDEGRRTKDEFEYSSSIRWTRVPSRCFLMGCGAPVRLLLA